MKPLIYLWLVWAVLASCSAPDRQPERRMRFTEEWAFRLGDDTLAAQPDYDDSAWRRLDLPHDWAVEGDFSENHPAGAGGGALPGGIGWYRKEFSLPSAEEGHCYYIDFDGVYMNATVYINGHRLGTRPYGYSSFSYNLTPYLVWGGPNVVAVRVDNAEQPNSRWYSGSGIYRQVWLRRLKPLHLALWGTSIQTSEVKPDEAHLDIAIQAEWGGEGEPPSCQTLSLRSELLDAEGHVVAQRSDAIGLEYPCRQQLTVANPHLWSVDTPYLYRLRSTLSDLRTGEILDVQENTCGIRTFCFDATQGFSLNGKRMKINGVCLHHDLGCLGAAAHERAIERQLEILKEMGCNAIRCSHNPPAPELLDLCDRMGFIVMDEAFDVWRRRKTTYDYARYFDQWHERDLQDMVLRDRNHPSILIWSIGNEVLEQWTDVRADTLSLDETNRILNFVKGESQLAHKGEFSVNALLTHKLAALVRQIDPARPITAGCNEPDPRNNLLQSSALDLVGFNYHDDWFADVPNNFPGKPFIVSESVSGLMTRGYYRMPSDVPIICPESWDKPYYDPTFSCSSYDNCRTPWGNHHEGTLRHVERNDFISGQFIWTGFDYLGEPTPYGWPAHSSYFGVVDLAGFPKDVYYLYQSVWRPDKPVLHLFPHWNWRQGEEIDLWCYYNQADEVELFLNGRSQGVRRKQPATWQPGSRPSDDPTLQGSTDFHVQWRLCFEPGTVKAVARRLGQVVAEQEIRTAGEPATLRLTPDRHVLQADGRDLCFLTVEVVDAEGNLCPWAENDIRFRVEGGGRIIGVDNGNPVSLERFKADHRRAFYGKCLVVVQSNGQHQPIRVVAQSDGGLKGETVIRCQ